MTAPNPRARMLSPAVAKDASDAWQLADDQARHWAGLRDKLADVWGEIEDMSRIANLLRVQSLLASLTREVDEAVCKAKRTPSERNKEFLWRQAQKRAQREQASA